MLNLFRPLFPESCASYLHQSKLGRLCCKANLAAKSMYVNRRMTTVPNNSKDLKINLWSPFNLWWSIGFFIQLCNSSLTWSTSRSFINKIHGSFGLSSFTSSRWARISASPRIAHLASCYNDYSSWVPLRAAEISCPKARIQLQIFITITSVPTPPPVVVEPSLVFDNLWQTPRQGISIYMYCVC